MIELPIQDPCELCEGLAGRDARWAVIEESDDVLTVVNPYQFETGQCCVITRRHAGTLFDLTAREGAAVFAASQRVAQALVATYHPLAIFTYQNNGVYSGQEVPHYHFHVVPRQPGSDWGIGPPHVAHFSAAGRAAGTAHDHSLDEERIGRQPASAEVIHGTADRIRANLPSGKIED